MRVAIVVVGLAAGGVTQASAAERSQTATDRYEGHSDDARDITNCPWGRPLENVCAPVDDAYRIGSSGSSVFRVPSWARSFRVSIRDDSGDRVAFAVYFDDDKGTDFQFANSSCAQHATLNLRSKTGKLRVERPLMFGNACGGAAARHTTGIVTVTFLSAPSTRPSPRLYVGGCSVSGVQAPFISSGFSGPTCSYTASKPGGYMAAVVGTWQIQITRGDRVIELGTTSGDMPCGAKGVIRGGDRVTIGMVGAGYLGVGDSFFPEGCTGS